MEFNYLVDKWINERVATAIEDQAKLHERDAGRIAELERKVAWLTGKVTFLEGIEERLIKMEKDLMDFDVHNCEMQSRLVQIDKDLTGIDQHNGDLDCRLDELEYQNNTYDDRIDELEEADSDALAKVRRYIREYFDSARIKVTIDKEVI